MIVLAAIVLVCLFACVYIRYANGSIVYISTGFKKDELFKIENTAADMTEAKILLSDARSEYEALFGSGIWEQTIDGVSFDDYVKEQVKTKLIRVYCMNIMAQEKGVVLSRSEKEAVDSAAAAYWESLPDAQRQEGITEEKIGHMFTEFAVANALYRDMTEQNQAEISADEARVITIQYICADSREDIEAAQERLDNREIFYVVAKEYNGEQYECELRRGEMDEAFEQAAFELKTGETSGIVEAGGRFYIIKCSSDNEKSKTDANKADIIEKNKLAAFNADFEPYEASRFVEFNNSAWKTVKLSSCTQFDANFEEIYNQYIK